VFLQNYPDHFRVHLKILLLSQLIHPRIACRRWLF